MDDVTPSPSSTSAVPDGGLADEPEADPSGGRPSAWVFRVALGAAAWGAMVGLWGVSPWRAAVAVVAIGLLLYPGIAMARSMATPLPPPPDPGTLRKVKLVYRCSLCGTEVRMTSALDEDPEPPRHCMEDMDLLTPRE